MNNTQIKDIILQIPGKNWEKALPIGKFSIIEFDKIITRPYSFVVRCRILGHQDSRMVFIKIYRNARKRPQEVLEKKIQEDYEIILYWYEVFQKSKQFRVIKPVMVIPEKNILITEESRGESLYDLILKNAGYYPSQKKIAKLCEHFKNVGAWLSYRDSLLIAPTKTYSIESLIEYIDVRLNILTEDPRRHFPSDYRKKILDYLHQHKSLITEAEKAVTTSHSDFNPGNILVNGNIITVLDFGRLVQESYLLDISKIYFQLHLLTFKPHYRVRVVQELQQALMRGFATGNDHQSVLFKFIMIRNTITHLANITCFWKQPLHEKLYNYWVLHKQLSLLKHSLEQSPKLVPVGTNFHLP